MTHAVTTDPALLPQALAAVGGDAVPASSVAGLALPGEPWDLSDRGLVLCCRLESDDDVVAALRAARRGVRLAVAVEPGVADRVLDALGGPGEARYFAGKDGDEVADLTPLSGRPEVVDQTSVVDLTQAAELVADLTQDQRDLLMLLAAGWSVPEGAQRLYLSLRTAERRLAGARKALGVTTTAEAVAVLNRARRR